MRRRSLFVLIVILCGSALRAVAQEAHPPQSTDQARPTHGIIRKPQPKPVTEASKPAPEVSKASAASTEAVAAAIANAVRSLEEKEKKNAEPAHAPPVRTVRTTARTLPQRRYSVKWPSQRFEVQWAAPVDRVILSWREQEPD